jgi:hypothetical protein
MNAINIVHAIVTAVDGGDILLKASLWSVHD